MNVDAIDPSTEMLDIAKERNCYKNVIVDLVGKNKVDIENGKLLEMHPNCNYYKYRIDKKWALFANYMYIVFILVKCAILCRL